MLPAAAAAVITTRRLGLRCLSPQLQYVPVSSIKIENPRWPTEGLKIGTVMMMMMMMMSND